jgi:hypothetical protein
VRLGEEVESLVVLACLVVHPAEIEEGEGLPAPSAEVGEQVLGLVEHLPRPLISSHHDPT